MRNATVSALGILIALAGLTSCTGDEGPPLSPMPVPSGTPVYASEEEALAAAEEVYGRYLEAENALGQGGWNDVSLVEPFVTGDALEDEAATAADFSSKGYVQEGSIRLASITLQQADFSSRADISTYICLDLSLAKVLDSSGNPLETDGRPDLFPLEVGFGDGDGALKIYRSDPWSGTTFC
jgi:hypothetical protein